LLETIKLLSLSLTPVIPRATHRVVVLKLQRCQILANQRTQPRFGEVPSFVIRRWMCHSGQAALCYQALVRLRPGWDSCAWRRPVCVRSFVTPFHKSRHSRRVWPITAKTLHGLLAVPHRQGPECQTGVYEESSTEKSGRPHDLTLAAISLPHERWNEPQRSHAQTGHGCEHKHHDSILKPDLARGTSHRFSA